MHLSEVCIRRPVLTTVMTLALLLFGLIGYTQLGMDLFPRIDLPFVSVTVTLPGASPEVMESDVTDALEEEISTIQGIKHLTSMSSEGVSMIFVEFVLERDIEEAAQDVRDKVGIAVRQLPEDADPPVVAKLDIESQPILWISVMGKGEGWSQREMSRFADKVLKPRFETLPGVGRVWLGGFQDREMRIWLDAGRMEAYGLSAQDVVQALRRENVELPGGRVESHAREFVVRTLGEFETAQAFDRMILAFQDGAPVRLQDVGHAEDGAQDLRSYARYQHRPSVGLGIQKQSGTNTVEVADRVKARLAALQAQGIIPADLITEVSWDTSAHIRRSVVDLEITLLYGSLLASVVIFFFLRSFRPSLISAISIPITLVATFSLMYALGFTLNNMTLLGLALSAGLVCDDAIIVVENIFRHLEEGEEPREAARRGTIEIAFAATAATLSIAAVFTPVAFVQGIMARFFREFAATIAGAVLLSLFVALTLVPMLCGRWMRLKQFSGVRDQGSAGGSADSRPPAADPFSGIRDPGSGGVLADGRPPAPGPRRWGLYGLLERGYAGLEGGYRWLLARALRHRGLVVLVALGIFAGSLRFWGTAQKEFIPMEDRGEFIIFYETPVGSSLEFTGLLGKRVEELIGRLPETQSVLDIIGFGERQEVHKGLFFVRLVEKGQRARSQMEVMHDLRRVLSHIPGLKVSVSELTPMGAGGPMGRSARLMLIISGPSLSELDRYARLITARLRASPGLVDVDHNLELIKPEVKVVIDREKAADLGVDVLSLASVINYLIGGDDVSKFKSEGERFDVRVRLIASQRQTPQAISRLLVRGRNGQLIQLSNLVEVREGVGPNLINRRDRQRAVIIYANLQGKAMGEAMEELTRITRSVLAPGYMMAFTGPAEAMVEFFQNVFLALGLSVTVTYLILAAQFESFLHPFTVMLTLPLSIVGALGGLWLTGKSLSITSLIGFLMLVGLVTKNGILLVDYTNALRARGMEREAALLQAGPVRLRPILMTAVTTIVGILPVALEMGAGAEARSPMGIAVAGGMLSSTALTLFVIPVAYSLLDDLRLGIPTARSRRILRRKS